MSGIDGIDGFSRLNGIREEMDKTSYQRIENTLERLKGIKGKEGISVAAKGFESLFIYRMLQEMRKTVPKNSLFGDSFGMDVFISMLDEKVANRIAESGSFGISTMLIPDLERRYEKMQGIDTANAAGLEVEEKLAKKVFPDASGVFSRVNQYLHIINEAAVENNLDPDLIKAVIAGESAGNPGAVSKSGAKGLMQLMDGTAVELKVENVLDPKENIFAGAQYLKRLLVAHNGDLPLALASYNAGPEAVRLYNGVPPYSETHNYIQKVMKLRDQFRSRVTDALY